MLHHHRARPDFLAPLFPNLRGQRFEHRLCHACRRSALLNLAEDVENCVGPWSGQQHCPQRGHRVLRLVDGDSPRHDPAIAAPAGICRRDQLPYSLGKRLPDSISAAEHWRRRCCGQRPYWNRSGDRHRRSDWQCRWGPGRPAQRPTAPLHWRGCDSSCSSLLAGRSVSARSVERGLRRMATAAAAATGRGPTRWMRHYFESVRADSGARTQSSLA